MSVKCLVATRIPSSYSPPFTLHLYSNTLDDKQHMALVYGNYTSSSLQQANYPFPSSIPTQNPTLVRIHSSCFTGETLGSTRCDCSEQLITSMTLLSQGGILVYMHQEGRNIGLLDKLL